MRKFNLAFLGQSPIKFRAFYINGFLPVHKMSSVSGYILILNALKHTFIHFTQKGFNLRLDAIVTLYGRKNFN